MTRFLFLAVCAAFIGVYEGTAEAADKPQPLTVKAPSFIGVGDVVVRMRIEPDPRSRELTLEWVSDEDLSGGSHAITLNGARAAATHQFAIKRLSPGEHVVTAILKLSDGTEIRRAATVMVVGAGGPGVRPSDAGQGAATLLSYPSR